MESVKRNTNGKDDFERIPRGNHAQTFDHDGKRISEKVEIFENRKESEIHHHGDDEVVFSFNVVIFVFEFETKLVINNRRYGNQSQKAPIPHSVEKVTRNQAKPKPKSPFQIEIKKEENNNEC